MLGDVMGIMLGYFRLFYAILGFVRSMVCYVG